MNNNDDFMNYVGYKLYGEGNGGNSNRSGCLGGALMLALTVTGALALAIKVIAIHI